MLTTIIYSISASEQVVDVTAVEARACARDRMREDRRQVDVKGHEHETDGTRDKHTGRAVPGNAHRLCLRFSVQRVFIRLLVSFTLFLRVAVAANADGADNHLGPGLFDHRGPGLLTGECFAFQRMRRFFRVLVTNECPSASLEALQRRVVEVRARWLANPHRLVGVVTANFLGAAHDGVASGGTSITEQFNGAAALDMRTVTRANGWPCFLGALHAGTHIARPDILVELVGAASTGDF